MKQHIKTRLAVRLLVEAPFQQKQAYVSISLAVALLIFLGPTFLLSQSAGCLSAEGSGAQAGDPQQVVSFHSFNEWHQGSQIEAAVTGQNPPLSAACTRWVAAGTGVEDSKGGASDGSRRGLPGAFLLIAVIFRCSAKICSAKSNFGISPRPSDGRGSLASRTAPAGSAGRSLVSSCLLVSVSLTATTSSIVLP